MAFALSPSCWKSASSMALRTTSLSPRNEPLFQVNQVRPRHSLALAFSRRRNHGSALTSSSKKKKGSKYKEVKEEEDDIDEDAFEALFSMLEEDLKNDGVSFGDENDDDDDDDIKEEDIEQLQRELEQVLGVADEEDDDVVLLPEDGDSVDEDDDDDEEERAVKLKNWQLRRLASALKKGRRKTSIKNLAAELCLDRALVLQLLRDPPPNLVMMSAALPDEPAPVMLPVAESNKPVDSVPVEMAAVDTVKSEGEKKAPVHVMRHQWSAQKRLKKVQVETLERVYGRTKRPTNTMIGSIVQVTNLPRKRVIKWFEDKRIEEGVPDRHLPYQRRKNIPIPYSGVKCSLQS